MDLSGLTEHLASVEDSAALEFPIGGRTYRVRPPSTEVGARCAILWAARSLPAAEQAETVSEALGDLTLPQLALGSDVVQQMESDSVPRVTVNECGRVAWIAWALGQAAAQNYLDNTGKKAGEGAGKARSRSRRPRRSGTPSGTALA